MSQYVCVPFMCAHRHTLSIPVLLGVVKYVYEHVLKLNCIHAHTLTHSHTISVCCLANFDWFFHSILLLSLSLSFTPTHSLDTRFDHFDSGNLFTLYHFNLIRAIILSRFCACNQRRHRKASAKKKERQKSTLIRLDCRCVYVCVSMCDACTRMFGLFVFLL